MPPKPDEAAGEEEEEEEEEDDYLSMSFLTPATTQKESSLLRTARLKKEAAERSRIPSKAELAAKVAADRDLALATKLDNSNKGAKMMAKMGFKGGALGRSEDARTQPIQLQLKDDRGGIGMESEKKRKVREAAEAAEVGEKRRKVGVEEFRERNRSEREERRGEGLMWGAMKVLEGLEVDGVGDAAAAVEGKNGEGSGTDRAESEKPKRPAAGKLRDVNVLYRRLLKQRLERDRERKMRYELNNSLSNRNDEEDEDVVFDERVEELEDEDPELEEFESLPFAERLEKIIKELREKYYYCFWCKYRYPDKEMEGCPGLTEDEHG